MSVKKPVRDTVMAVGMHKAASRRLPQAREGIKPTRTRSPCRTFSKTGQCRWGDKCRWQHVQVPGSRTQPRQLPKGKRVKVFSNVKFDGACYYCGVLGHKKTQCRKLQKDKPDRVNATYDFAWPVKDSMVPTAAHPTQVDQVMLAVGASSVDTFLIDGGSTCHVLGFESSAINASLHNIRTVNITIVVGGGTRMSCRRIADVRVRISSPDVSTCKVGVFKDVRIVPGFGANLLCQCCHILKTLANRQKFDKQVV